MHQSVGTEGGWPWVSLISVLAFSLIIVGLILGVVFDRVGSVEIFFSGVGLLLLMDSRGRKATSLIRNPTRAISLAMFLFAVGFVILLLVGSFQLIFYNAFPAYHQVGSILGITGVAFLVMGVIPYFVLMMKRSANSRK